MTELVSNVKKKDFKNQRTRAGAAFFSSWVTWMLHFLRVPFLPCELNSSVQRVEVCWLCRCRLIHRVRSHAWRALIEMYEAGSAELVFKLSALVCERCAMRSSLYIGTSSHIKMTEVKNPSGFCYSVWPCSPPCVGAVGCCSAAHRGSIPGHISA